MQFIKHPTGPNEVMDCGDFFISYNPLRQDNPWDNLCVAVGQIKEDNLGRPETAIIVRTSGKLFEVSYYILYGDYREAYAAIAHQGLEACMALFEKHIQHITDTSDVPKRTTS